MERIIEDLLTLIKTDAASYEEKPIADLAVKYLEEIGMDCIKEDNAGEKAGANTGNIYARLDGTLPGTLLLSAHMDRMPKGKGIEPVFDGKMIRSAGDTILAGDDLCGIVGILDGLRRLKASGKPHCTVEVLFTIGEEIKLLGSLYADYSNIKADKGVVFDSSGDLGKVIKCAPYAARLNCTVKGRAAHAGVAPEKGCSALIGASKILADIKQGRLDSESTANFSVIFTNTEKTNVVCEECTFIGETRSIKKEKLNNYIDYFMAHCKEAAEAFGCTAEPSFEMEFPGFDIDENDELIRSIFRGCSKAGVEPYAAFGGGGMDCNNYNQHGIKSVGVSCGYYNNHSSDECIDTEQLIKLGEVVCNIILEQNAQ